MTNVQLLQGPLDGQELDILPSEKAVVLRQKVWFPSYHERHGEPPEIRKHIYVRSDATHFIYRKTK